MFYSGSKWKLEIGCTLLLFLFSCTQQPAGEPVSEADRNETFHLPGDTAVITGADKKDLAENQKEFSEKPYIIVDRDIQVRNYFSFIDSCVARLNKSVNYELNEHLLVRNNPWMIDTLASFDYYKRMERGEFIYDMRDKFVLCSGDTLWAPDEKMAKELTGTFENTLIDLNIPEFRLRIFEYGMKKYEFTVRVGRNERKYLELAKREVSLQTPVGKGEIVRIERNPIFINPATGKRYYSTLRDDGNYTMMPQIPWLEPSTGGVRTGSLIHPTTNPETLGKAYSNGCVGTGEGDAWILYYHAPVGTKVVFRYDLEIFNETGESVCLKDIYDFSGKEKKFRMPAQKEFVHLCK